jgi:hypothetical protein
MVNRSRQKAADRVIDVIRPVWLLLISGGRDGLGDHRLCVALFTGSTAIMRKQIHCFQPCRIEFWPC